MKKPPTGGPCGGRWLVSRIAKTGNVELLGRNGQGRQLGQVCVLESGYQVDIRLNCVLKPVFSQQTLKLPTNQADEFRKFHFHEKNDHEALIT